MRICEFFSTTQMCAPFRWNWVVRMEVNGGFKEDVAAAGLKVDFINRKTAVELIKSDDEARKKASAPPAYALVIPKKCKGFTKLKRHVHGSVRFSCCCCVESCTDCFRGRHAWSDGRAVGRCAFRRRRREFFAHGLLRPDDLPPMSDDEFDAGWADNLCQPSMQRFATLDDDSFDEDLANSLCEELALDAAADYACSLQCK